MPALSLMDEIALRKRVDKVYSQMRERAKPRLWKSGKKRGTVRVPGIAGLPFTRQELWDALVMYIGPTGCRRCAYCEAIGRPANLIDVATCVFDHKIPLANGGTWDLDNLVPVCADCNNRKGHLSYEFFVEISTLAEKWPNPKDRAALYSCLRTHGVTQRIRFAPKKDADTKAVSASANDVPQQPSLLPPVRDDSW